MPDAVAWEEWEPETKAAPATDWSEWQPANDPAIANLPPQTRASNGPLQVSLASDRPQDQTLGEDSGNENAEPVSPLQLLDRSQAAKIPGRVISTIGNIPAQVYNAGSLMTKAYPPVDLPFQEGKSVLPPSLVDAFKSTIAQGGDVIPLRPSPALKGISESAGKAVEGMTTPEGLATLPLFEFKLGRAAMLAYMAKSTPEQIKQTVDVMKDPNASPEKKWESGGDAFLNLAMQAGLALHLRPEAIKERFSPEEAAKAVEQSAVEGGRPIKRPGEVSPPPSGAVMPPDIEAAKPVLPRTAEEAARDFAAKPPPPETKTSDEEAKPEVALNPGGAYADLPPELKKQSDAAKQADWGSGFAALKAKATEAETSKNYVQELIDHPTDKPFGKFNSNSALQYGASLDASKPEQLAELKQAETKLQARYEELKKNLSVDKVPEFNAVSLKKQLMSEAIQAATGIAEGDVARKLLGPDYKPPFPETKPAEPAPISPKSETVARKAETTALSEAEDKRLGELDNIPDGKMTPAEEKEWGDLMQRPQYHAPNAERPSKNKGGRKPVERPPDIIDHIIENYGSIRNKKTAKPGSEGHYTAAYNEARKNNSSSTAGRKLFSDDGSHPNEIVDNLRREGMVGEDFTVDDLWDEVTKAQSVRRSYFKGEQPEQKLERFHKTLVAAGKSPKHYMVSVGDLSVGDKFKIQGEEFVVNHIDPDTGEVQVKDGPKFGFQTIPDGEDIPVNKGSLDQTGGKPAVPSTKADDAGLHADDVSTDFLPPEEEAPAVTPKLGQGEKQGDLISSTQSEPLALVGEKGTDADRLAAQKDQQEKDRQAAIEEEKKNQGGFEGMGGAVPREFAPSSQTATSIRNAKVDQERATRGLPPAYQPLRRSFGEVWDRAMAMIDHDPKVQDDLIEELRDKPRALTDVEDAMLLHRQVDLQNDYGRATRELAQAYADGNNPLLEENKLRVARLSDQLLDIYNIGKSVGTETGRGLNARKMMANEDFTLAKMELDKRAANQGRPLTDAERSDIQGLHDKIAATQKAYDDYVASTKDKLAKAEIDRVLAEAKATEAGKPKFHPKIIEEAKRLVGKLDTRADAARARLKDRLGRTSAGLDPTLLKDLADIGASHLGHAIVDFAEWSAKMVGEFGDLVKPHLQEIYNASDEALRNSLKGNLDLAREMARKPPEDQIKANSAKIGEKVKAGKKGDITWYVQRIARLLVQSGVTDREALIDTIHKIMSEHIPDMTRRETMDAISGYGDYKQLSKDAISLQLRGMKGEMQQLAKLEDMAKGEPPKKSGVERRTPTEAERQLIKAVNDAKFKFQVPIDDPNTQLKSALDTLKTTLRNRTKDLQDKLDREDFAPKERRELKLDNEAMRLKSENERVKQNFQQALNRDRLKNRPAWQKTMDTLVKWRRGFLLSGPVTLAKLTTAAIARGILTPAEEAVGAGLTKVFPGLSERAPRQGGGFNTRAEVKAITEGFTSGMRDAWDTLRTGKSSLELTHGKDPGIPQSFIDIFGNVHGALKAPVKRAEFARSFEKRANAYAAQGVDVTDPFVQQRIGIEAYQDAQRAIFMQKNMLNDAYKRALSRLDQADKKTGKPTVAGKVAGTAARVLLPIVKVPTNIVAETMEYAIGTLTGSARLAKAYHDGIKELPLDQGDLIMRQLKKGSLGAGIILLGYFNPKLFGGFYQQGVKRDPKDIPPDAMRVGGHNIPSQYIHNPFVVAGQLGATISRVSNSKLRKKDKDTEGLSHGAIAGALGLADAIPFIRETVEVAKAMKPSERDRWEGELAKSLLVPAAVDQLAQYMDKDSKGRPVQRKPTTPVQAIETGIPGLRKNVPKK
jgi:hypothetical protein